LRISGDVGTDDRAQEHHAGVVDEDVQPSEPIDGLLDGCLNLDLVGDVGWHHQRGAARLVDRAGEGFQAVLAAGDERDGRSVLGEFEGGGGAYAAARAGDEGRGAGQLRFHGELS
jgi:hypothetical protein